MRLPSTYWRWYILAALAVAAVAVWGAVLSVEARLERLFIHVLDVGQGDAIFIEAPGGVQILIDGGPDKSVLTELGKVMPFWDRSIDALVLTHPHADHLAGLIAVLERYEVGMVIESGVNHSIAEYAVWKSEIARQGIRRIAASRGQVLRFGGAQLMVLSPFRAFDGITSKNIHDASVVLELYFASSTALFMADAEAAMERAFFASGGDAPWPDGIDILKVGHHGSKTSTSKAFLSAARPRYAVISAGRKNRYGHPAQEVLDRLANAGVEVFRTDLGGATTFVSDGRRFVPAH